jgi:hypothetical protein
MKPAKKTCLTGLKIQRIINTISKQTVEEEEYPPLRFFAGSHEK